MDWSAPVSALASEAEHLRDAYEPRLPVAVNCFVAAGASVTELGLSSILTGVLVVPPPPTVMTLVSARTSPTRVAMTR